MRRIIVPVLLASALACFLVIPAEACFTCYESPGGAQCRNNATSGASSCRVKGRSECVMFGICQPLLAGEPLEEALLATPNLLFEEVYESLLGEVPERGVSAVLHKKEGRYISVVNIPGGGYSRLDFTTNGANGRWVVTHTLAPSDPVAIVRGERCPLPTKPDVSAHFAFLMCARVLNGPACLE